MLHLAPPAGAPDSSQAGSRVEGVVAALARQVRDGELAPGRRLPSERALCAAFGVGRTTVREALKLLQAQGLVARERRGLVVADPALAGRAPGDLAAVAARATIRDLYDVRKLIETRMTRWAALRRTKEDLTELRSILAAGERPAPEDDHTHARFHDAIARAAHNAVLLEVYDSSRGLFFGLPFFWRLLDEAEVEPMRGRRHELAHRWHRDIVDAVDRHDPDDAEGAMFQHLDTMEKDLLRRLPAVGE